MRTDAKIVVFAALWTFILIASCTFAWASYEECRLVHPRWYCIAH